MLLPEMGRPLCDFKAVQEARSFIFILDWFQRGASATGSHHRTKDSLRYLNLSHCTLSEKLFNAIALKCEVLSVLILQDSKGISQEAFKTSCFKSHRYLKLINVAYITEALAFSCVLDLLEYNNCTVQLDIRGHHLSELEIDAIERAYPTASVRIVEIDHYRHMLY